MEKKKFPRTDPNTQVHSEFETTVGNSFRAVVNETPASNKNEADLYYPLNQLPENEYSVINEWDREEQTPVGESTNVDKVTLLIVALGLIGLIGVVRVVKAKS